MKIAFFGDTHGQVYHLLAAVVSWQKRAETSLDMVIQVGDFGAERLEKMTQNIDVFLRYPANNPAQFDFLRVLYAGNQLATHLREMRRQLQHPIYFLRGDHDEGEWLRQLSQAVQHKTIPIDPFDLFHYVPDGTIIHCGGMKLAFFGGSSIPNVGKKAPNMIQRLLRHCWKPNVARLTCSSPMNRPLVLAQAFMVRSRVRHK